MSRNRSGSGNRLMTVVTRFAPSPTGNLHIGSVRTALIADDRCLQSVDKIHHYGDVHRATKTAPCEPYRYGDFRLGWGQIWLPLSSDCYCFGSNSRRLEFLYDRMMVINTGKPAQLLQACRTSHIDLNQLATNDIDSAEKYSLLR